MIDEKIALPRVLAIVVARGSSENLTEIIESIAASKKQPTTLIVANVDAPADSHDIARHLRELFGTRAWVVDLPAVKNFGEAIRATLTSDSIVGTYTYMWLLHDDTKPHPEALEALVMRAERGGTIAAVGPKQVRWGTRDEVLEVGIEATRSGRRLPLTGIGEIDQGQYDDRGDVLAVGTAGMLVRAEVWRHTRGLDPHLGPFGDGLEYGRRLRRSGYRVTVEPRAVVEHAQQSFPPDDPIPSYGARREAQLYNWMVACPPLMPILLLIWLVIWSPIRAIGRLVSRQPRLAASEIKAFFLLIAALPAVARARRRVRRTARVPRSALTPLEASSKELRQRLRSVRKIDKTPRELLGGMDSLSLRLWQRSRRRSALILGLSLVVTTATSYLLWYRYLAGIEGGDWINLPATWTQLWEQSWSLWSAGGNGAPGPAASLLTVISVLTAPLSLTGMSPLSFGIVLMMLAWPGAFLGGWALAGSMSRSLPIRVAVGLLWMGLPPLTVALENGQLGQVIAWVALPYVFACLWRVGRALPVFRVHGLEDFTGWRPTDPILWGALGALALIVASSAAPGIVLIVIPVAYLIAWTPCPLPRSCPEGLRATVVQRTIGATVLWVPAAVWLLPSWPLLWKDFAALFDTTGIASQPLSFSPLLLMTVIPAVVTILWALGSLVVTVWRPLPHPWLARVTGVVVVGCLGILIGTYGVSLTPAALWAPIFLGLITIGMCAVKHSGIRPHEGKFSAAQWRRGILASTIGVAGLVGAAALFIQFLSAPVLAPASSPLIPVIAQEAQKSPRAGRLLVLQSGEDGVTAQLWRGVRTQVIDRSWGLRHGPLEGDAALAQAVGTLAARPSESAAQALASHAIDLVLIPQNSEDEQLRDNLDASGGMERIGTTDLGTLWRVRPQGNIPARVTLNGDVIPAGEGNVDVAVAADSGSLYMAENHDAGWSAWFNGTELEPIEDVDYGWRQGFDFPGGEGRLVITYRSAPQVTWGVLGAVTGIVALALAVPWKPRRTTWHAVSSEEEIGPRQETASDTEDLESDREAVDSES
ncbi:glycosyltransferase [Actinomycetaceae bacterium WB03_NA08]|uniref:Glycosyltransferase n=1 Tax=Scrofimicrobium canadense TaxID=2652290 RepID=A0A6N7W3H1_9ACTO|nr:glycosyltransferase [Scrofimicrobium canadense]MSS83845.1 glycosyltransferase [Scrofimicrobium canadense]